jgi:probable rRNA maturation factor
MLEIQISTPCPRWPKSLKKKAERLLNAAAQSLELTARGTVSVVLADDVFVQALNKQYRGQDKPTNVLSFQQETDGDDPTAMLEAMSYGDIILAFETVEKEASEQKKLFENHFLHLVLHGFLHLLGHDHEDEAMAKKMEDIEITILNDFGIKNPYQIF